ncbi:MAG TPA: VOC family protein [Paenibacillus sp.]|nr:VOC family protein [Paenibacillus sp.]
MPPLSDSASIVQLGFVVRDARRAAEAYADFFRLPPPFVVRTDPVDSTRMTYRGRLAEGRATLAFLQTASLQLEFIEPDDAPSDWRDFLEARGEGLHHFAVNVSGMAEKLSRLAEMGIKAVQTGEFAGGRYACVDTAGRLGTTLELLEEDAPAPPTDVGDWNSAAGDPPADNALGTKRIVHLGFLANDAARTAAAYAELFGAKTKSFVTDGYDLARTTYRGQRADGRATIHLVDLGAIQIELIQPDAESSVWRADLDASGEGFHHLAFDHVRDVPNRVAALAAQGIAATQRGEFPGGAYTYLDAKASLKTNLELLERW